MRHANTDEFHIESEADIVMARKAVREAAAAVGFGITDVTRIVTAASELVRNIYVYAGSGMMRWRSLQEGNRTGLELKFEDQGPGIANVDQAMEVGFTSGNGMGMGLPGAKRLMDELVIQSKVGSGTTVIIRKWLNN